MSRFDLKTPVRLGLILLGVLALGACDSPNRFSSGITPPSEDGDDGSAPTVEIQTPRGNGPTARPLGDSLLVEALVVDDQGVDSVVFIGLEERGDPALGTDTLVLRYERKVALTGGVEDTTVARYLIATEDLRRDTAQVIVTAYDAGGNQGADTALVVLGGPAVELLNLTDGQSVQAGLTLSLQLRAVDPSGVTSVSFQLAGAFEETLVRAVEPSQDTVRLDTTVVIPPGARGDLLVTARAANESGIDGQDGPVTVNVIEGGGQDVLPPSLTLDVLEVDRMEVSDSTLVTISGSDDDQGGGVVKVGYTIFATSASRGDTIVTDSVVFASALTGSITQDFQVPIARVDSLNLPDTVSYEVMAWMVDDAGNCAAAVSGTAEEIECGAEGVFRVAEGRTGLLTEFEVFAGRTVRLPTGGLIMDAAVDTLRRNLLLSNIDRDRVEVFRLQEETFLTSVPVGSEPWGLSLNRGGDTLLVANSGGTNISNVFLGPAAGTGPISEDPGRRFLTPDVVLYNVERRTDDLGALRYTVTFTPDANQPDFSDRPQFLAVDSTGRMLFSTRTTEIGNFGTIRKAFIPPGVDPNDPDLRPEIKLFIEHAPLAEAPEFVAVGHVDDVTAIVGDVSDEILIEDHVPGFPNQTITGGPDLIGAAADEAAANGSDITTGVGRFSVENLGFGDTTFVSASGDGGWVAFGEGSVDPVGRIIMYEAATDRVSGVIPVTDLMTNPSETVRGIGLNYDGTLGVAQGDQAYFFTTDLRHQGVADMPAGGAGAVMHPLHANARSLENPGGEYRPNTHMAFVGTGEGTIDVIDTFHFFVAGRISIRDQIAGPLRASLPFPEDNAGVTCQMIPVTDQAGNVIGQTVEIFAGEDFNAPHPADGATLSEDRCIVLKLYGVTDTGGVVVVDVRKSDILRNHPARQGS